MAHMIWRGAVSFGLVHVPVRLFPATTTEKVGFNLLDKRSLDPIGYKQINKRSGKEVAKQDIVRGFKYEKGKYVVLSDDEILAANPESTQTIDILAFVEAPEVSFLYLDTPYFLAPDRGGSKVYALLREALAKAGKIAIANVVLHRRQHLAALVPNGDALVLNTLRWAAEVLEPEELKLPPAGTQQAGVSAREMDMAMRLIDDMTQQWQPAAYHDTFHDDILALVKRKIKAGKAKEVKSVQLPKQPAQSAEILDLSDLLRRSLSGKNSKSGGDGASSPPRRKRA
jgi:DNA end-binding protein Ku